MQSSTYETDIFYCILPERHMPHGASEEAWRVATCVHAA